MPGVSGSVPLPEDTVQVRLVPPDPNAEDDVPRLYANFVQATMSPLDLTFHFGWYALPTTEEPPRGGGEIPVPVRPVAKVSIPLPLVKGILRVLESQLAAWEQNFGTPVPDQPRHAERGQ